MLCDVMVWPGEEAMWEGVTWGGSNVRRCGLGDSNVGRCGWGGSNVGRCGLGRSCIVILAYPQPLPIP